MGDGQKKRVRIRDIGAGWVGQGIRVWIRDMGWGTRDKGGDKGYGGKVGGGQGIRVGIRNIGAGWG